MARLVAAVHWISTEFHVGRRGVGPAGSHFFARVGTDDRHLETSG